MSFPSTTSSLVTYIGSSDDGETPCPNRSNPFMAYSPPPPQTDPPRAYDAPINYYDDEFEEEGGRWNAEESLMRHLQPEGSEEGSDDTERGTYSRHERMSGCCYVDQIVTLDDWTACVGTWLLACMSVMVVVGAVAMIWILVTQ